METEFCQARGGVDCVVDHLQDTTSPEDGMNALQAFCGIIIVAGMSFAVSKRCEVISIPRPASLLVGALSRPSSPTEHVRRVVHYIYDRCLTSLLTIWPFLPKEGRPASTCSPNPHPTHFPSINSSCRSRRIRRSSRRNSTRPRPDPLQQPQILRQSGFGRRRLAPRVINVHRNG